MASVRTSDWEEELLTHGVSERAKRVGVTYAPAPAPQALSGAPIVPNIVNFGGGFPDPKVIPMADLHVAADAVFAADGPDVWRYGSTQGYPELRAWLADHWSPIDGVPLTPDNFTLTNGSAGAMTSSSSKRRASPAASAASARSAATSRACPSMTKA
jgi:DNA-binding transcriptional MocR family regulator